MNEGVYRVLFALGDGSSLGTTELVRRSGESVSQVKDVLKTYPSWFEHGAKKTKCSTIGLAALAREMVARTPYRNTGSADAAHVLEWLREKNRNRRVRRELDHVRATEETVLRRAELLTTAGDVNRGLVFLGDEDLTSMAVHHLVAEAATTVIDIDEDVLDLFEACREENDWMTRIICHNLREPLPRELLGRFGCVFTDPPYAPEGFALFLSRAADLLRPDGRLYLCFGHSRRSMERGLKLQKIVGEAGFLVLEVKPEFNRYHGALSIGSKSALWVCSVTPQTRALRPGRVTGDLYTRRSPSPR